MRRDGLVRRAGRHRRARRKAARRRGCLCLGRRAMAAWIELIIVVIHVARGSGAAACATCTSLPSSRRLGGDGWSWLGSGCGVVGVSSEGFVGVERRECALDEALDATGARGRLTRRCLRYGGTCWQRSSSGRGARGGHCRGVPRHTRAQGAEDAWHDTRRTASD